MSSNEERLAAQTRAVDEIAPPISDLQSQTATSAGPQRGRRWRSWLSFSNIGAIYIWVLVIVVFAIWVPSTFISMQTISDIANNQAVTALVALSLIVPLSAAVFDLSVGYTLGVTSILVAKLIAEGVSPAVAIIVAMLVALGIGLANGVVVVIMKIDSFIGTLATGALLSSLILLISSEPIASATLLGGFAKVAGASAGHLTLPVFYVLAATVVLWYVLEHTPAGRQIYATGYNRETARLSGIRTERLRFCSLLVSASLAGFAGVVLTSRVTSGDPTVGPAYLLPAFAAAFVGATQLRHGRFNAWGTIIAILLLGTGNEGLADVGAPQWAPSVFAGVTLILAVGLTGYQRRRSAGSST
jgi:ribose/xylose/arabinose/galactoside ABC-type transport system permease subunit